MRRFVTFFTLLLLAFLLIPTVSATYNITGYASLGYLISDLQKDEYTDIRILDYDALADSQDAIILVHFKVPSNSYVNFTIHYGSAGSTVSGWAENHLTSFYGVSTPWTVSTIHFNGETKSYTFFDTNPEYDYNLAGYARTLPNDTAGIIVYHAGYGSFDNDLAIYMPLSSTGSLAQYLINRIELSSPTNFDVDITHGPYDTVAKSATTTPLDEIPELVSDLVSFVLSTGEFLYDFVSTLFRWLKFFFVENLAMTTALYLALSMAYSASRSKDIFAFFKRFISDQVKLYQFIVWCWDSFISIIHNFRRIFGL